ncbi:hypothetical protein DPEC_G00003980 [Dallia pectoralis]|uniref:Uncharacterized protein n=1 Tax=Dallia pectoralis TaxID=75939 RepID=A0ACC2HKD8_DALPE|nr:hypothetical protein DPEC_G00003980 [Dallia pectoralis]
MISLTLAVGSPFSLLRVRHVVEHPPLCLFPRGEQLLLWRSARRWLTTSSRLGCCCVAGRRGGGLRSGTDDKQHRLISAARSLTSTLSSRGQPKRAAQEGK